MQVIELQVMYNLGKVVWTVTTTLTYYISYGKYPKLR